MLISPIRGRPLKKGDRVRLFTNKPLCSSEFGHGEFGTVASIEDESVSIHLDIYHNDLDEWDNCFIWTLPDMDEDTGYDSLAEWLRGQLEILDDCQHVFSHLNDELMGERVCTTCNDSNSSGPDWEHRRRWGIMDPMALDIADVFDDSLIGGGYFAMWRLFDTFTTYQLNRYASIENRIIKELEKRGYTRHSLP